MKTRITLTGQKLRGRFQLKDKTNEKHRHNLIYHTKFPKPSWTDHHRCETCLRITERTGDHAGKEKQSNY